MRANPTQVHRILDREDAEITLKMLFRLAHALNVPLLVELGEQRQKGRHPARRPAPRRAAPRSSSGGTKATSKRAPRRPAAAE